MCRNDVFAGTKPIKAVRKMVRPPGVKTACRPLLRFEVEGAEQAGEYHFAPKFFDQGGVVVGMFVLMDSHVLPDGSSMVALSESCVLKRIANAQEVFKRLVTRSVQHL